MKLKFVANFRNRPSKVLWNALYRNFISNLVLYTTPKLICFEFLSCLNKGLNDGWWLRVTHSWHRHTWGFRVQTNMSGKQDDFSTFSTKALDISATFSHIHEYNNKNELLWNVEYILPSQFQELLRYSEKRIALIHLHLPSNSLALTSHVSQTKCPNFHRNASFFLFNLVCWNKDQRLNQFGRPKFEFDSAHVKYRF